MTDRDEIKERVKAAVDLADWMVRDGVALTGGPAEFKGTCPFHDDKNPSFTVFKKDGHWSFYCFGCEATGDIFEWVMRRKSIAFQEALKMVANTVSISLPWAGERLYQPAEVKRAAASEPARGAFDPQKYRSIVHGGKVWEYLTGKRGLDGGLLVDYSVGETADGEAYAMAYKWWPAYWPANRLRALYEFVKVVKVDRPDGKKVEWRDPTGGKNILFGMESTLVKAAQAGGTELVICEGELDAITWAQYGWPAVSIPSGAKYTGWIQLCWDWLQAFKKIHVSFDEDPAGRMKLVEVVTRLGIARTDIVRLPLKESQESMVGGVDSSEEKRVTT